VLGSDPSGSLIWTPWYLLQWHSYPHPWLQSQSNANIKTLSSPPTHISSTYVSPNFHMPPIHLAVDYRSLHEFLNYQTLTHSVRTILSLQVTSHHPMILTFPQTLAIWLLKQSSPWLCSLHKQNKHGSILPDLLILTSLSHTLIHPSATWFLFALILNKLSGNWTVSPTQENIPQNSVPLHFPIQISSNNFHHFPLIIHLTYIRTFSNHLDHQMCSGGEEFGDLIQTWIILCTVTRTILLLAGYSSQYLRNKRAQHNLILDTNPKGTVLSSPGSWSWCLTHLSSMMIRKQIAV
jgi:hypothetical protein